jgi:predicted dehydrogenase
MPVPLRMGLVGAGPWAELYHAPMLSSGPATSLDVVWARRRGAAESLAAAHGAQAVSTYDELLERCDAVAFAVPPDVQAELAPRAAAAGKHLLLEKPLAFDVAGAERITRAVDEADVRTVLMLRNRFSPGGRRFVQQARAATAYGAQASSVSGAALPGASFATPWRVARGALMDVGPHVLDLLDAAMGAIEDVQAVGDPLRWLALTTRHPGGALGQVALSINAPGGSGQLRCEVFTDDGLVRFDGAEAGDDALVGRTIAEALADSVATGRSHEVDVHRGLRLQQLLAMAESTL